MAGNEARVTPTRKQLEAQVAAHVRRMDSGDLLKLCWTLDKLYPRCASKSGRSRSRSSRRA